MRLARALALTALIPLAAAAISLLFSSAAVAASYRRTDGTIVDPIEYRCEGLFPCGAHPYSGTNLEPFADLNRAGLREALLHIANLNNANLFSANLRHAYLIGANLSSATLSNAHLSWAVLNNADLSSADLRDPNLFAANLWGANLEGADLSGTRLRNANLGTFGAALYDLNTDFTGTGFDQPAGRSFPNPASRS